MTPVLSAALAYAGRGWPVVPLHGPTRSVPAAGKAPWLPRWVEAATCDPDMIASWWRARPDSNVGLVTGPRSGLVVLDVDPRHGGRESLCALEERVGMLPAAPMVHTGGGGLHLVFRHPGGTVRSAANVLGPGLDVRGDGGQVVAAPSRHPSGGLYAWHGGQPPEPDDLKPWPLEQLAPILAPVPTPLARRPSLTPSTGSTSGTVRARVAGILQTVMDAPEGERNVRLFWSSCRVAEMVAAGEVDGARGRDGLLAAAEARGLTRAEASATIDSAGRSIGRVVA